MGRSIVIHRHDRITDNVFQMMSAVGFRCRRELTDQFEGKQRPDLVYDYVDAKKLLLDITIAHPCAKKYITKSSCIAGSAAAEKSKPKIISTYKIPPI